jgi:hypothetical protein
MTEDPLGQRHTALQRLQRDLEDPDLNPWTTTGTTVHGPLVITDPAGEVRTVACPDCGRRTGLRVTLLAQVRCPCGTTHIDPAVTAPFATALHAAPDAVLHPADDQFVSIRAGAQGRLEAVLAPRT